jgi:hypothetical protein
MTTTPRRQSVLIFLDTHNGSAYYALTTRLQYIKTCNLVIFLITLPLRHQGWQMAYFQLVLGKFWRV